MTRRGRIRAEAGTALRAFRRRRTAVVFTFLFPALIVLIFGALVRTGTGGSGLFTEPAGYYVPGYVAVVVLFTPLTRTGSEVARHREGNRFEKLATTPLTRGEWLIAHGGVTALLVTVAAGLVLALTVVVTDAAIRLSVLSVLPVVLGALLFAGIGAVLGRVSDSRDGVVAASNAIALPLVFLSETFVPPEMLPSWFRPVMTISPLTYATRSLRALTYGQGDVVWPLGVLFVLTVIALAAGILAIPTTE